MPYNYDEWCEHLLNFLVNAIDNGNRIFDTMMNKTYEEKLHYYGSHSGTKEKLCRVQKGIYAVRNFIKHKLS